MKYFYSLFLFFVSLSFVAQATHIKGGEIIYRRISETSLTYEVILRGYTDLRSNVIFGSNGTIVFGDGQAEQLNNRGCDDPFTFCRAVDNDTYLYEAPFIHTYPGPGSYIISFYELYRNDGVLNINNSVNTPFYIESQLVIDPMIGMNNSPEFEYVNNHTPYNFLPNFWGTQDSPYLANFAAYDPNGDSLAYKLVLVKEARGIVANGYRFPHQTFPKGDERNGSSRYGSLPICKIHPVTGLLVWDSPGYGGPESAPAEYTYAIQVEEWRKVEGQYYRIGYITRDISVVVSDVTDLEATLPALTIPAEMKSQQLEVGKTYTWTITATAVEPEDSVDIQLLGNFLLNPHATVTNAYAKDEGSVSISISYTPDADDLNEYLELGVISRQKSSTDWSNLLPATDIIYINRNPTEKELGWDDLPVLDLYINYLASYHELQISGLKKEAQLRIIDLQGRTLHSARLLPETNYLLPELSSGIYILLIQNSEGKYSRKFMF